MAVSSPQLDAIIAGGGGAIPTTALWQEIKDLIQGSIGAVVGQETLAGNGSSVTVTFADIGTVDYDVLFSIEYNSLVPAGSTGEIRIEIIDATAFKVYNSGSDAVSKINYRVVLK